MEPVAAEWRKGRKESVKSEVLSDCFERSYLARLEGGACMCQEAVANDSLRPSCLVSSSRVHRIRGHHTSPDVIVRFCDDISAF